MVIGEEDGSDSFSDDRGSDDSSGWRLRGWGGVGGEGRECGRGRALGTLGLDALGEGSVWPRSRKVGRPCEREGSGSQGQTQEEGSGCVSLEGGFRTRRRGVQVGAQREEGQRFIWQTGCCGENSRGAAAMLAGAIGQDRGPAQRCWHPRRGRHRKLLRHGQQRRPRRRGPTATTATVGARFEVEMWAAIRPSGSKVRLGDEVRDRGQSSSDRDDGSNFSDEGDSDSISDDPGTATTARTERQRRATAGAMASCRGDVATSERDRTADSNAGWPHEAVRRRFDVDETRTVFGTVRRRGSVTRRGHAREH